MASISVADRSMANIALLGDPVLNEAPIFPFRICHKNGFFERTITALPTIITFRWGPHGSTQDTFVPSATIGGWALCIGASPNVNLILHPTNIVVFSNGYSNPATQQEPFSESGLRFQTGATYLLTLDIPISGTLHYSMQRLGESTIYEVSVVIPGMGDSVDFTFGYPTQDQATAALTNQPYQVGYEYPAAEGMVILSVEEQGT